MDLNEMQELKYSLRRTIQGIKVRLRSSHLLNAKEISTLKMQVTGFEFNLMEVERRIGKVKRDERKTTH